MRRLIILLKNILFIPYRILFTHISPFCILQNAKIDKTAAIASNVKFYRSQIGKYSYVNYNTFISDTEIGNFTSIGSRCEIGGATHPLDWVSTSPVFHKWENIMKKNFSRHDFPIFSKTTIGNDVWIGSNVMVKAGVSIGDGAVIGMGAVVTKNIGPYEVWAGNPAHFIKLRIDSENIRSLQEIKWWDWTDDKLEKYAGLMNNPVEFILESRNE